MEFNIDDLGLSDEAKATLIAFIEGEKTGLDNKNKELLGKLNTRTSELNALKDAAALVEQEQADRSNDIEAIKAALNKKYETDTQKLKDENGLLTGQLSTLLIDNSLSAALDANNVIQHMRKPLMAMFKADAKLIDGTALIGETELTQYVNEFFASDDGKAFVSAGIHTGTVSNTINSTTIEKPKGLAAQISNAVK